MLAEPNIRSLGDYEKAPQERVVNPVYGFVVDATRPHYKPHNSKYIATLKIMDESWNQSKHPAGFATSVKLILMSPNKFDIPHIKVVGTIIKFKDAILKRIGESPQQLMMFSWDATLSSSKWELFEGFNFGTDIYMDSGIRDIYLDKSAMKQTDKKSIDPSELPYLEKVKAFQKLYFPDQLSIEQAQTLKTGKNCGKEFDIVGKLLNVSVINESEKKLYKLKMMDHTGKAILLITHQSMVDDFPKLDSHNIFILKGVKYKDIEKREIELADFGNMLVLPITSYAATEAIKLMNLYLECSKEEEKLRTEDITQSFLVSQIPDNTVPITKLKDAMASKDFTQKFRVRVYAIEIGSEEIKEWVKGYCSSCMKVSHVIAIDPTIDIKCKVCGKPAQIMFQIQFFVKDWDDRETEDIYKLLLYTHNGKGFDFFDHEPPANLYKSDRLYRKLKRMYKLLTRFGIYWDCIIERMTQEASSFFQITDTVVSYENLRVLS